MNNPALLTVLLAGIVSAQTNLCSTNSDFHAGLNFSVECIITTQDMRTNCADNYGNVEEGDTEVKCKDVDAGVCENNVGGTVMAVTCDNAVAHLLQQGDGSLPGCDTSYRRQAEAMCCNVGTGAQCGGSAQIQNLCTDGANFDLDASGSFKCQVGSTAAANCISQGYSLESQDECKTGTQSNCAAVGGFWSAATCNQYAGALSYANASTICTAHNFYYVQQAKMDCCGGNMGTLCGNAGDGICANNADFTPAVTAGIQCNVYSQQARDDCSASGYEVSDDKCELVPGAAECSAVGGAWESTSCHTSATFMQIMIAQGMNFSQPGAVMMPLTLQSRCCGGNPGSGLYGPLPQMCQSGTTMTSSAIMSGNCNVRLPTMQNACTSAGYGLTGDNSTECSSNTGPLTSEQCSGIGGIYESFTCQQAQVYLASFVSPGTECTPEHAPYMNIISQTCCGGNGAVQCAGSGSGSCDARAQCHSDTFSTVGISESCFNAVVQAGIPQALPACVGHFVAANVSVACQQAVDGALNAAGCPRVTACGARAQCHSDTFSTVGVSEDCFDAVVQAGIPQTQPACVGPFVAANVSVACQQAVDGALNASGCPRVTASACDARAQCHSDNFSTVGVSEDCFDTVVQAGIPYTLPACAAPFVAANVSVACQQAVDGALNAAGCPRVTACDAQATCVFNNAVGVSEDCFYAAGTSGIPQTLPACNFSFVAANVSVLCKQAVDAALTAGCTTPSSSPALELTFPGELSSYDEAAQTEIKTDITTEVEQTTGAGTVARVDLLSGSIMARVIFRPSANVTASAIDQMATEYTSSPMTVTVSGGSLTSSGAANVDPVSPTASPTVSPTAGDPAGSGAAGQTSFRGFVATVAVMATVLTMA